MTAMNIKKIIAREVLILLGLTMLFAALLFLNQREQNEKYEYEKTAEIVEVVEIIHPNKGKQKTANGAEYEIEEILTPTGIYVMLQQPMDLIRIQETLKKDFPQLSNPELVAWDDQRKPITIQRYYDHAGQQKKFNKYNTALLVVLFSYPVYLVIRFILWAVRTLKR